MQPTPPAQAEARRAQLHGWIHDTQRRQRRARWITVAGVVLGAVALTIDRTSGLIALLGTAVVGGVSYWVTAAHLSEWRMQLEHLDRTGRAR